MFGPSWCVHFGKESAVNEPKRDLELPMEAPREGWPTYLRNWAKVCDEEKDSDAGPVLRAVADEMDRLAAAAGPRWTTSNNGGAPAPVPPTSIA